MSDVKPTSKGITYLVRFYEWEVRLTKKQMAEFISIDDDDLTIALILNEWGYPYPLEYMAMKMGESIKEHNKNVRATTIIDTVGTSA